ncbi:MAG TPA: IS1595 family transposase [Gemmatimonadales bacterium]|nr:IS1595 family transposase [Usitatibacter sp.]
MDDLDKPHFRDAGEAREFLESLRWPEAPVCPRCRTIGGHYRLDGKAHRRGVWKCHACRAQFTVTVGTVFGRSKIALNVWLQAVHLLCSSTQPISSRHLQRLLGVSYKTARSMSRRIREAMKDESFARMARWVC